MSFIKRNLNLIGRLLINQFAIVIFAFVLICTAIMVWEPEKARVPMMVISIFSICFYGYLIYVCQWERGCQDIVRMEAGRLPYSKTVGFRAGLVASIPNAILFLLLLIGFIIEAATENGGIFMIGTFGAITWGSLYYGITWSLAGIPNPITENGMDLEPWIVVVCYAIALLILPCISHLGYRMGQKNKFSAMPNKKKGF